jgi:type I restriction enzyme, S subunit
MSTAWPLVSLNEFLSQDKSYLAEPEDRLYKKMSVRLYGKGVALDSSVDGISLRMRKHQIAKENQIVVSEIWAKKGAIGIVPEQCSGALCTSHFFLFDHNPEKIDIRWLSYLLATNSLEKQLEDQARGTTGYAAIRPSQFLNCEIRLPPLLEQQRIAAKIDTIKNQLQVAEKLRSSIECDIDSLLAGRFQETLKHANWLPMRKAAPIVRREVSILSDSNYSELGVRSFFKGAFIRRSVAGEEFTWQKLYQIKSGDLIFSNIMAWEKAIALANSVHNKCVGNHRMLTCEANPEVALPAYLHYYFTTDEGFTKVYAASPGTAARNRTLTADALMSLEVPIPSLALQKQFVNLKNAMEKAVELRRPQMVSVEAMLPALCNQVLTQS